MPQLYPPVEPVKTGYLEVGSGHEIYFEDCGNPDGLPVLFLHGGPGSSCNAGQRRYFDPARYRIVLFDQRGCGRSRPRGERTHNTTLHLLGDIEALRARLGIDRWMLFGGSWGSTLALTYALSNETRVLGMVLRGVFLATQEELRWYCEGLRAFVPEAWHRLTDGLEDLSAPSIMAHYGRALHAQDALSAALAWTRYESAVMAIGESAGALSSTDSAALIDRARVQLHYLLNDCFLSAPLLDRAADLRMPTRIVQGRRDLICPPQTAYDLHRALHGSELVMVEEGGHSAMHPAMTSALVEATDSMASRLRPRP